MDKTKENKIKTKFADRKEGDKLFANLTGGYDFLCALCKSDCFDHLFLCSDCAKTLTENNKRSCAKCGRAITGEGDFCGSCGRITHFFDRAFSAVCFEGAGRRLCHRLKFGNARYLAEYMGGEIAKIYRKAHLSVDVATFVPMSLADQKQRQYNQSHLLCQHFCDILNLPCENLMEKVKQTPKQEECTFSQRLINLRGAFALAQGVADRVKGARVALIDDVLTTGSTADACAQLLKKNGAAQVIVLTYASRKETLLTE